MNPPTCSHGEADVNKIAAVVQQIAVVTFILNNEKRQKQRKQMTERSGQNVSSDLQ